MKSIVAAGLALAFGPGLAQDPEQRRQEEEKKTRDLEQNQLSDHARKNMGEILVCLTGAEDKSVDWGDVLVGVLVERKVPPAQWIVTERASGEGRARPEQRGEVREMEGDGIRAEVVIFDSRPQEGVGRETPKGDSERSAEHVYFRAPIELRGFRCGMERHPTLPSANLCSLCEMRLRPLDAESTITVFANFQGRPRMARGFRYPLAEKKASERTGLLSKLEGSLDEIQYFVQEGALSQVPVHTARILERVRECARENPDSQAVCADIEKAVNDLNLAAAREDKEGTQKALDALRTKIGQLKKPVEKRERETP